LTLKRKIKALLIDLEGVVYQEGKKIPGSISFIQYLEKINFPYLFLTNTTTMPRKDIANKLLKLGLKTNINKIITPLIAAKNYLKKNHHSSIALYCNKRCYVDFQDFQINFQSPDAVIVGDLYKKFSWEKLNEIFLTSLNSKKLIAFHKNKTGTRKGSIALDLGPFVKALEYALDNDFILMGKPSKFFFQAAVDHLGFNKKEILMVGDDKEVDIRGAQNLHLQTCLVKTGKYGKQIYLKSIEPSYILPKLSSLKSILFQ